MKINDRWTIETDEDGSKLIETYKPTGARAKHEEAHRATYHADVRGALRHAWNREVGEAADVKIASDVADKWRGIEKLVCPELQS